MASNMQQFGTRGAITSRVVNKVGTIDNLRVNIASEAASCRTTSIEHTIKSTSVEHPIDMCLTLQETEPESAEFVGAIGGYQYGRQTSTVLEATVPTEYESRVVYNLEIQIFPEHAGFKPEQLSKTSSKISSTIFLPTTTTTSSTMGQFSFCGRVDEVDE
ncbi:hypothetical protein CR513_37087, partial [Mucuna pruriens]